MKDMTDSKHNAAVNTPLNDLADVINLMLCMYAGQLFIDNPIFGAALYVSSTFLAFFFNLFQYSVKGRALWGAMFAVSLALGTALIFLYPSLRQTPESWLVCGFVLTITFRSAVIGFIFRRVTSKRWQRLLVQAAEAVFMVPVILIAEKRISGSHSAIIYIAYLATGLIMQLERFKGYGGRFKIREAELLKNVGSYRVYRSMTFCTYTAFELTLFLYLSYMFCFYKNWQINTFLLSSAWLCLAFATVYVSLRFIKPDNRSVDAGLFVAGAALWIVASVQMFKTQNTISRAGWSMLWAVGLALIYAVLTRIKKSIKLYSVLLDREISDAVLSRSMFAIKNFSLLTSGIIMMIALTSWSFAMPYASGSEAAYISGGITQLPLLFIGAAVYFALQQPMDANNETRLKKLFSGAGTYELRQRLRKILVGKYRKRVGVRLIIAVLRPVMRHKVTGMENVKTDEFPSVFVCNHGEIYGPVAAVLYLPYYFRPWIDERVLNPKKISEHYYNGTLSRKKLMPEWFKRLLARLASRLGPWAFGYFDPIPVYREGVRALHKTFSLSVAAMQADENILLFPENPKTNPDERYSNTDVSAFYTGFAHIGKAYYSKTGKCPVFYPIYSDKRRRVFRIGEGIRFDPENGQAEEKRRIAYELNAAMRKMAESSHGNSVSQSVG